MAHQQDPAEIAALVRDLSDHSGKSKDGKKSFSCRQNQFKVEGTPYTVTSWKFQDWDYKRTDLPTYARGLFTMKNEAGQLQIVTRGYDKFFNVEEVSATRWRNIEEFTKGPYELSVKENGCIIFASGLEDGTLLVCSKHSTGGRADLALSHAQVGEQWIKKHVEAAGKSIKDLAKTLYEMNATAVGELCDDAFEEHVLAYTDEMAGFYLHGLNYNVSEFATEPSSEVHKFADTWGFKKAKYLMKDTLAEVKEFLDKCAETGAWDGRDTEGFVVRCKTTYNGNERDWFFKYKFEEPYLMYRQWREATRAVISAKPPRFKKHQAITEQYLHYARKQLAKDPTLADRFNQNHGIIGLRDGFLKEVNLRGSDIIRQEMEADGGFNGPTTDNVVLVPIATIGCGKTTVALALVELFGWGHFQNDNVIGPKNRPRRFANEVCSLLAARPVVIADRNNHQRRERKQLMDDVSAINPDAKYVALHYVHEPKFQRVPEIRKVTLGRVLARGDNHQTIQAATKEREVAGIIDGFLGRFEGCNTESDPDNGFDQVIDLDPTLDSRDNLETVISKLHEFYPKLMGDKLPSAQDLDEAIKNATSNYAVGVKHDLSFMSKNKKTQAANGETTKSQQQQPQDKTQKVLNEPLAKLVKRLEYFRIGLPNSSIASVFETIFPDTAPDSQAGFYRQLLRTRRVQDHFHVTLIHRASSSEQVDMWRSYAQMWSSHIDEKRQKKQVNVVSDLTPKLAAARVLVERAVWDNRVMCLVARILPSTVQEGSFPPNGLWPCANEVAHITIGTVGAHVKPKESNDLLQRWLSVGSGGDTGIHEEEIRGNRIIEGEVGAVLSKF